MNKVVLSGGSTPPTTGVTIFAGRFGSGKTEAAINYALALVDSPKTDARGSMIGTGQLPSVKGQRSNSAILIDLDIVTPYFRSREVAEALREQGVQVITPTAVGQHLDVPAIAPEILGAIQQSRLPVILDVGGDRQGARALGQFSAAIRHRGGGRGVRMHFVINPYRPFTDTANGLVGSVAEIEASARLRVTSLVSNPNLMGDTTPEIILDGHARVEAFARVLKLPIAFVCIERRWAAVFGANGSAKSAPFRLGIPILALDRHFVVPWQ